MATAKISQKGWIVIPAEFRRKYGLKSGDHVDVIDYGGVLVITPTPENPVEIARGFFSGGKSLTKALLEDRAEEREREKKKETRFRS